MIAGPFSLPDLSRLDGALTANYIASLTIDRAPKWDYEEG
jgi:hypothetical protein